MWLVASSSDATCRSELASATASVKVGIGDGVGRMRRPRRRRGFVGDFASVVSVGSVGDGVVARVLTVVVCETPVLRTNFVSSVENYYFIYDAPQVPSTTRDQIYELLPGVQINGCIIEDNR